MVNKRIFVTFQRAGIHCYPEAGINPDLSSVAYLANPHRHMFHFKVSIDVMHNNREIEFIMFKEWLERLYSSNTLQLNNHSCEMIAEELYTKIQENYPERTVIIEVSEDGENGAIITFNPSEEP